jgi:OHCU decarboxylase
MSAMLHAKRPTEMSRSDFIATFGDIFEHTPEIAETAFDTGLDETANTAEGLHAAMVAAMRMLSDGAKEKLIKAHPDLAGRLAIAKQLTADSAREQGSAGLDTLTSAERESFTALNHAYQMRFRMPFIMAVKGRSKAEILKAFEERMQNDGAEEFARALSEIERIALLRLRDRLPAG